MKIAGIGSAFPEMHIEQARAAEVVTSMLPVDHDEAKRVKAIYRRTGIRRRHSVLLNGDGGYDLYATTSDREDLGPTTAERMAWFDRCAGPLAARAGGSALEDAGVDAASITHLVTVTCTGFAAPGVGVDIIGELALPATVERTHVGFMGCHGALNGLRTARAFTDAGGRTLLVAVDLSSLHFQYAFTHDNVVANALFADGAAAVVADVSAGDWSVVANGSLVFPDSRDAMTWHIGNHGFTLTLSPHASALIEEGLLPWVEGFLRRSGLTLADIGSFAVHPGGPRILDAVEGALRLPPDALATSRGVLADYGNMSSPTVLVILQRMRREGAEMPCLALAFGPGLTVEAVLIAGS